MEFQQKFRLESRHRTGFDTNDRAWIKLAYVSVLLILVQPVFGGIVGPLFVVIAAGINNRGVETESREALNFGITLTLVALVVATAVEVVSFLLGYDIKQIASAVFAFYAFGSVVMAWRNTTRLKSFRHPLTIRFIKEQELRHGS